MNFFNVNFDELYRRHLCRHSQLGINVLHIIAVLGVYYSLVGIGFALPGGRWIVGGVLIVYTLLISPSIPFALLMTNVTVILGLIGLSSLYVLPIWVNILLILFWHRFQIWNHKIYDHHHDMSEFSEKYKKGPALFLLLSLYELPILLNYLVYDQRSFKSQEFMKSEKGDVKI